MGKIGSDWDSSPSKRDNFDGQKNHKEHKKEKVKRSDEEKDPILIEEAFEKKPK